MGLWPPQAQAFDQIYSTGHLFSSIGWAPKFSSRAIVYLTSQIQFFHYCTIGISCLVCQYYNTQGTKLNDSVNTFFFFWHSYNIYGYCNWYLEEALWLNSTLISFKQHFGESDNPSSMGYFSTFYAFCLGYFFGPVTCWFCWKKC